MAWKKERKAMMHAGMFFKLCPRSSSLACPNKHNPPVSNVAPLPLSSTVFTEARLKPHQFSSCHCTAPAISAFLARGRKYLLSKTRPPFLLIPPPFPDVEFKGIKSSEQRERERRGLPFSQKTRKRGRSRRIASQWEPNGARVRSDLNSRINDGRERKEGAPLT